MITLRPSQIDIKKIRDYAYQALANKKPHERLASVKSALDALHRFARAGHLSPDFDADYLLMVGLHKEVDFLKVRTSRGQPSEEEILIYERVFRHFLEIARVAREREGAGSTRPGIRQLEPYAKFIAGMFALMRRGPDDEQCEEAYYLFAEAEKVWGKDPAEIAQLILDKKFSEAEELLGGIYKVMKKRFKPDVALPIIAAPVLPALEVVAPPPAADEFAEHCRAGDKLAREDNLGALREYLAAAALRDDERQVKYKIRHVLGLIYSELDEAGKEEDDDGARKQESVIGRADKLKRLLGIKPDELKAYLLLLNDLVWLKRESEALRFIDRARQLTLTPEEKAGLDYFTAVCYFRQKKDKEALAIITGFRNDHPYYRETMKMRVIMYARSNDPARIAEGLKLLAVISRTMSGLFYEHQFREYQAELLLGRATLELREGRDELARRTLTEAGELSEQAEVSAKAANKFGVARNIKNRLVLPIEDRLRSWQSRHSIPPAAVSEPPAAPAAPADTAPTEHLTREIAELRTALQAAQSALREQADQAAELTEENQRLRARLSELELERQALQDRIATLTSGRDPTEIGLANFSLVRLEETWEELELRSESEIRQGAPALKNLFVIEKRTGSMALSDNEVRERRKAAIRRVINLMRKGKKITPTFLKENDKELRSALANDRVLPEGFNGLMGWVREILLLLGGPAA